MNAYLYATLQQEAETKGVWIDTQSDGVMRGRDSDNTNKKERVSRALSWYEVSKESDSGSDERLVFSIIAFNALYEQPWKDIEGEYIRRYGNDPTKPKPSKEDFARNIFYKKMSQTNYRHFLFDWNDDEIKCLEDILSFQYVSVKYWKNEGESPEFVRDELEEQKRQAKRTRKQIRSGKFMPIKIAIKMIVLLRNQLLHGLSAYKDSYNRTQINLCSEFMFELVGRMIMVVIMDDSQSWGKVSYPPQQSPDVPLDEIQELKGD